MLKSLKLKDNYKKLYNPMFEKLENYVAIFENWEYDEETDELYYKDINSTETFLRNARFKLITENSCHRCKIFIKNESFSTISGFTPAHIKELEHIEESDRYANFCIKLAKILNEVEARKEREKYFRLESVVKNLRFGI